MLVISRKENESIKIEPVEGVDLNLTLREVFAKGPIVLTLTHIGPRRVRILIEAPSVLKIMRGEIASAGEEEHTDAIGATRNGTGR